LPDLKFENRESVLRARRGDDSNSNARNYKFFLGANFLIENILEFTLSSNIITAVPAKIAGIVEAQKKDALIASLGDQGFHDQSLAQAISQISSIHSSFFPIFEELHDSRCG